MQSSSQPLDKNKLTGLPEDIKHDFLPNLLDNPSLNALAQTYRTLSELIKPKLAERQEEQRIEHIIDKTIEDCLRDCILLRKIISAEAFDSIWDDLRSIISETSATLPTSYLSGPKKQFFDQLLENIDSLHLPNINELQALSDLLEDNSSDWKHEIIQCLFYIRKQLLNFPLNPGLLLIVITREISITPTPKIEQDTNAELFVSRAIALLCETNHSHYEIKAILTLLRARFPKTVYRMLDLLKDSDMFSAYLVEIFRPLKTRGANSNAQNTLDTYLQAFKVASPTSQLRVICVYMEADKSILKQLLDNSDFDINHRWEVPKPDYEEENKNAPVTITTALIAATYLRSKDAVELILEKNPNPFVKGQIEGKQVTALDIARNDKNQELITLLQNYEKIYREKFSSWAALSKTMWPKSQIQVLDAKQSSAVLRM